MVLSGTSLHVDMMDVYNKIPCIAKNDETGYRVSDRFDMPEWIHP